MDLTCTQVDLHVMTRRGSLSLSVEAVRTRGPSVLTACAPKLSMAAARHMYKNVTRHPVPRLLNGGFDPTTALLLPSCASTPHACPKSTKVPRFSPEPRDT
jgi:hypothetical protein